MTSRPSPQLSGVSASVSAMRQEAEVSTAKSVGYYGALNTDLLETLPGEAIRFLDVGCAEGRLGKEVKKRRPHAIVHGVERDAAAVATASRRLDRVFCLDLEEPLPKLEEPYDCLIFGDILEHLIDPWTVLRQFVALLSPHGHVVASIPNLRHYKILRDLVLRGRFTYRDAGILDATHLRFFTLHEMERLFSSAGLRVVARRPCIRGGNAAMRLFDRLLFGRLEPFRAYQYVLVGQVPAEPPIRAPERQIAASANLSSRGAGE